MANILKLLSNEKEKGNTLISKTGEIQSEEKVREHLKKVYKDGIKKDIIDIEKVTFEEFRKDKMNDYKSVDYVIGFLNSDSEISNEIAKVSDNVNETESE